MLKGICKEFITVKIPNNPLYDEAIFVLKSSTSSQKNAEDMSFEANRILCQSGVKNPKKRKRVLFSILFSAFFFVLGTISGFIVGLLL